MKPYNQHYPYDINVLSHRTTRHRRHNVSRDASGLGLGPFGDRACSAYEELILGVRVSKNDVDKAGFGDIIISVTKQLPSIVRW